MYLLNAAKLRHQAHIVGQQRPAITTLKLSTYQQLNRLQGLMYGGEVQDITKLLDAELDIARMQAQTDGLIDTQERIATFQRTIDVAAANIATITDAATDPTRRTLIDEDRAVAQRISADLDDDHAFLAAITTRAQNVAAAAHARISQYREQNEHTTQHRAHQYSLLQTGILTAVVTALTAVQAFGYTIRAVPAPAQPAIIALLAAITLLLYAIPLHHGEQRNTQRIQATRRRWPARLLISAAGLTGAITGWTAASLLPAAAERTHWTGTLAIAGLVLAAAASIVYTGSRSANGAP